MTVEEKARALPLMEDMLREIASRDGSLGGIGAEAVWRALRAAAGVEHPERGKRDSMHMHLDAAEIAGFLEVSRRGAPARILVKLTPKGRELIGAPTPLWEPPLT